MSTDIQISAAVNNLLGCKVTDLPTLLVRSLKTHKGEATLLDDRKIEWEWLIDPEKPLVRVTKGSIFPAGDLEPGAEPKKIEPITTYEEITVEGIRFHLKVYPACGHHCESGGNCCKCKNRPLDQFCKFCLFEYCDVNGDSLEGEARVLAEKVLEERDWKSLAEFSNKR